MSSAQHPHQAGVKLAKKATDTSGMQAMFERYTNHLPQKTDTAPVCDRPKTLAVVGSTGFLGPHIIASLLSAHKHSTIFCLNRSLDGQQRTESALHQLMGDNSTQRHRLQFWVADMTQPNFGLAALQAGLLASQVDELIFNAWNPHWGKELAYFDSFLAGIRNAVDFCAAAYRRPRITFISSICAVGDWPTVYPLVPSIPEAVVWDNHSAMPHGYGESKCVAEQVLAKAHEVSGIQVSIIRAGQIGGPSRPSLGIWPQQGWLYSIMIASSQLGVLPTHVQRLDWIPVDILAHGIANSTRRRPSSSVEVFNALHPKAASWKLLYRTLRYRFNLRAEEESLPEWLSRFDPTRMKLHGFLTTFGSGREYNMAYDNQNALEVLPPAPVITEDLLVGWLSDWKLPFGESSAKL
jgi:thioester reductase-like protein